MTQAAQKRVLEQYYAATAAGEFLDVSKITATGTGTKRQKTPANGWAGTPTKKAIRPLQVLSDNFPAYKLAIELMGAEPDYITEFKKLYGEGYVNAAPAPRSPAVKAAPVAIASLGTRPGARAAVVAMAPPPFPGTAVRKEVMGLPMPVGMKAKSPAKSPMKSPVKPLSPAKSPKEKTIDFTKGEPLPKIMPGIQSRYVPGYGLPTATRATRVSTIAVMPTGAKTPRSRYSYQ